MPLNILFNRDNRICLGLLRLWIAAGSALSPEDKLREALSGLSGSVAMNGIGSTAILPNHSAIGYPTSQSNSSHEFLYHGSCRRCHHLHQARIIHLSSNNEVYTSYACENCDLPIFGFGRTSPRDSLVSLLTTSSWQSHGNRDQDTPGFHACTNNPEQSRPSERPVDSSIAQSTVTQHGPAPRISLASSSRTRHSAQAVQPAQEIAQAGFLTIPALVSKAPSSISNSDAHTEQHSSVAEAFQPTPTSPVRKILNQFRHVRHKILWSNLGTRKRRHSGTGEPRVVCLMRDAGTMTDDMLLPERPVGNIDEFHSAGVVVPLLTPGEPPSSMVDHTQPDEVPEEFPDQYVSKRERLHAKRRQTTLQQKALRQPPCLCDEGCQCMGSRRTTAPGSVASIGTSTVPSHHMGHLISPRSEVSASSFQEDPHQNGQERHVAFTGGALDDSHPTGHDPAVERLSEEELRFSRQSTSTTSATHDSQATTAINSSSSGDQSSPRQSVRANSLPLQPFLESRNRYLELSRPEVLAVLRNFSALHPPQPAPALSGIDSVQETQSWTVGPARAPDDRPSTPQRASTTSLSHLPVPSDTQDSPASEHDSTRTSGAPTIMPAGGSSQMTPTPRSPDQGSPAPHGPQVNPDELADEIEQLASQSSER
ncbi:hypothetical protein MMC11_006201 [Xylographa trunciseda]|nr:hypothetical protein [Xylographa trunciseda]